MPWVEARRRWAAKRPHSDVLDDSTPDKAPFWRRKRRGPSNTRLGETKPDHKRFGHPTPGTCRDALAR